MISLSNLFTVLAEKISGAAPSWDVIESHDLVSPSSAPFGVVYGNRDIYCRSIADKTIVNKVPS